MPRPGFYNDNENRSYPFLYDCDISALADAIIVDFGCTMGQGAGFIEGEHSVYLVAIRKLDTVYEFEFQSDAPGLMGLALIFRRAINAPEYQSSYSEASFSSGLGTTVTCAVAGAVVESRGGAAEGMMDVAAGDASCPDDTTLDVIDGIGPDGMGEEFLEFLNTTVECEVCSKGWLYHNATSGMSFAEYKKHCGICSPCYHAFREAYGFWCIGLTVCDKVIPPVIPPWVILDPEIVCRRGSVRGAYCYDDTPWSGYLVTGDLSGLSSSVEDCTTVTYTSDDPGDLDILFLTDTTGSMSSYIRTIKDVFPVVANSLVAALPNFTFRWAVADYRDFEDGGYSNGYNVGQTFTSSIDTAATAIDGMRAGGGGDLPEQQIASLKNVADEWTTTLGGQAASSAQRMVLWAGDVPGWENNSKGYSYPELTATVTALVAEDIKVFGINSKQAGRGIDASGRVKGTGSVVDGRNQASTITSATGGHVYNNTLVSSALEIAGIIADSVVRTTNVSTSTTCNGISGSFEVEPATIQNMAGSYVRTVNVANAERTRSTKPDECRDHCWPFPLKKHYIACTCLEGVIRIKPGYNTNIYQEEYDNKLILEADPGAGEGPACGPVPLFAEEDAPRDRTTLDGGLTCDEVIRSINGVGKQFFAITGGAGVVVSAVPEQHKIVIDVDLHNLAACIDLPDQGSLSSMSSSESSCDSSSSSSSISP